jgi:hypothetical protein
MNKARLSVIVVITVLVAVIATACQGVYAQTPTEPPPKAQVAPAATTTKPAATTSPATTSVKYVGQFSLTPSSGLPGTVVQAAGSGFDPDAQLQIVWQGISGSWNVDLVNGIFNGRQFQDNLQPLATVTTDANGQFAATFTAPSGFGFEHDVRVINKDGVVENQAAFDVTMQASISPSSGPVGTPITIELNGVGWRALENSWVVLYDNKFVGFMSAVTTGGLAQATIPAVGAPGKHIIGILGGSLTFPYMNIQQSPISYRPTWTFEFTVTDGPAVLPAPAQNQSLPTGVGTAPASTGQPVISTDLVSGIVGTPVTLKGSGLPAGAQVDLLWFRMTGNRISGQGYQETSVPLGTVTADANGEIEFPFKALDDLGGAHRIEAHINGQKVAETNFTITPSAFAIEPASGPAGTTITIHLKGVGWTQTANIYTLVYDNAYVGYACGFNSQGDVTIYLPAAGEPGWHFIDLYPAIYQGTDMSQDANFRIPQLTYIDHPGEKLPAFHFAFQVTR